ncbi:uncharacterized protein AAGF69_007635 isoform 3-T3 [Amazona ochrocephala]
MRVPMLFVCHHLLQRAMNSRVQMGLFPALSCLESRKPSLCFAGAAHSGEAKLMELQLWRTGFSDICCRLLGAEDHGSMRKMSLSSLQPQPYTAQPCSCFLHQPLPLEENFHMLADPKPTGATRPSPTDFGCKQREGCVQRALPASLFLHLCRTELRQEYGALTLAAGAPIQLSMDMMRHKGNGTNSASTEQSHFKAFQPEDGLGCCVCLRGHTKPALRFHKGMPFKKPYVMIIEFESPSSCSFSWSQQHLLFLEITGEALLKGRSWRAE